MAKISVIIPTLSNITGVTSLTPALSATGKHNLSPEIIVINNGNEVLEPGEFKLITNKQNYGFARAVNQGAKAASSERLLILNDDVSLTPDATIELINFQDEEHLDAVSPVLINHEGSAENFGYRVLPQGKISLNKTPGGKFDGLTAACLLIKKSVFTALGGFDEDFFAYLEDVDFFLRMKKHGYQFGVAKDVKVVHQHMATSLRMGNFKCRMDAKNWIFLIVKDFSLTTTVLNFPAIFLERLRNLNGILKATPAYLWLPTVLQVYGEVLIKLPKMIQKRHSI